MILPPFAQVGGVALVAVRFSGDLATLAVDGSGVTSLKAVPILGWKKGLVPRAVRRTATPGLFVVIATEGGEGGAAEIDLVREKDGKASVVDRKATGEALLALGEGADADAFYVPQDERRAATFHVAGERIVWDVPPIATRAGTPEDFLGTSSFVLGTRRKPGERPFWLTEFRKAGPMLGVSEIEPGKARPVSGGQGPSKGAGYVAAWRAGERILAMDAAGRVAAIAPRGGKDKPLPGTKPVADRLDNLRLAAGAPVAVGMGIGEVVLLGTSDGVAWKRLAALKMDVANTPGESIVLVDDAGRWAATVGNDGVANVLRIGSDGTLRLVKRVPRFYDNPEDLSFATPIVLIAR